MTGPKPVLLNGMGQPQGIWEVRTTPVVGVGTRGALDDGRVFYYAKNSGAAIVAGNLLTVEVQTAQFTELACNTALIGDTTVTVTLGSTAVTVNEYEGGYLFVIDDTGEGITYRIDSHPAANASASLVITLKDPIYVDFGAATTVQMMKNPWADVVIAPTGQGHHPAGISQVAVGSGATTPQYFWCQTWGPTCAWQDEIVAVGSEITSGPTAGQVEAVDAVAEVLVGTNLWTSADTENAPVMLKVMP